MGESSKFRILTLFVITSALIGSMIGISFYTFVYGQGFSYFREGSEACANCHVMQEHYDAWSRSSHSAVASCNDCHTPKNFLAMNWVKAVNGWNHAYAFTWQNYKQPFETTEMNRRVAQQACVDCHEAMLESSPVSASYHQRDESCVRCHGTVGHRL